MALTVKHSFVSAIADGGDATLVQPSNWNAAHTITGSLAASDLSNGTTGSGLVVLATSPSLTTPNIDAATGTSLQFTDLTLLRDSANILAQRNSTNAQTLRVYNTFTDAANYERGVFDWGTTANVLTIGTQNAGTGSARPIALVPGTGANPIYIDNQATLPIIQLGGTTSSFPAVRRSSQTLQAILADGSDYCPFAAQYILVESANVGILFGSTDRGRLFMPDNGIWTFRNDQVAGLPSFNLSAAIQDNMQLGQTDAATATAQTLRVQSVAAGNTNTAGANWTIAGSLSNGSGASGDIIIQTGDTGAASGTQNALNTALTIKGGTAAGLAGSVVLGKAAIATTATDGFLYIPTCAGAPTGVPTAFTGRVALVWDTTNHKFWVYDTAWKGGTNPGAWT